MRFDRIFEDLEGRFVHQEQEEIRAVSEELARAERAQLALADRLRAAGDRPITIHLEQDLRVTGSVEEVGWDWLELREQASGARVIVPSASISMIAGLSDRARPREEALRPPRSLCSVLRGIARDRGVVRLERRAGRRTGRVAAVGADALDVDQVPTGERSSSVTGAARLAVAMSALLAIRPGCAERGSRRYPQRPTESQ